MGLGPAPLAVGISPPDPARPNDFSKPSTPPGPDHDIVSESYETRSAHPNTREILRRPPRLLAALNFGWMYTADIASDCERRLLSMKNRISIVGSALRIRKSNYLKFECLVPKTGRRF